MEMNVSTAHDLLRKGFHQFCQYYESASCELRMNTVQIRANALK